MMLASDVETSQRAGLRGEYRLQSGRCAVARGQVAYGFISRIYQRAALQPGEPQGGEGRAYKSALPSGAQELAEFTPWIRMYDSSHAFARGAGDGPSFRPRCW